MTALMVAIAAIVIGVAGSAAVRARRRGEGLIKVYAKHLVKVSALLLIIVSLLFVCVLSCYAQLCAAVKHVLSVHTVDRVRQTLKLVSGADSAFVAIQTLAFMSAMLGFASCVACSVAKIAVCVVREWRSFCGYARQGERRELALFEGFTAKTFLLYSRYNS